MEKASKGKQPTEAEKKHFLDKMDSADTGLKKVK
jgi:hypothetical protein